MLGDRVPETTSQTFGAVERDRCGSMFKGFSQREQSSGRGAPCPYLLTPNLNGRDALLRVRQIEKWRGALPLNI